jgi:hypothetical protein
MSHEYCNPNGLERPQYDAGEESAQRAAGVSLVVLDRILASVREEFLRASAMHSKMHSLHEAKGVIEEEFDEFWEDVRRDDVPAARKELVQLAAMAVRALHDVHSATGKPKPAPLDKRELLAIRHLFAAVRADAGHDPAARKLAAILDGR